MDAVVDRARRKLSRMEPLLFDVTANDLAIVKYKDTKFEEIIHALPLSQALDDPAKAEDLYADL